MTYFRLNPDCYYVTGANGAVVYDIPKRRLFVLDREAQAVLQDCESLRPLSEDAAAQGVNGFLDALVSEELGMYYCRPVHIEKLLLTSPFRGIGPLAPPPQFGLASWSITSDCDHDCGFCPHAPTERASWSACRSCVRSDALPDRPGLSENAAAVITQLSELGFRALHIRGGNPLLNWERLSSVVAAAAARPQLQVTVTTPGTGRAPEDVVRLLDQNSVRLNIVLRGFRTARGSGGVLADPCDSQVRLLDQLHEKADSTSITVNVADGTPAPSAMDIQTLFGRWGIRPLTAEFYRIPRRGDDSFRFVALGGDRKPLYLWRSPGEFFHRMEHCSCLHGAMELALDGSVRPCAGCVDDCGNATDSNLRSVLKATALYEIWRMNKDTISVCRECAMRYACCDCLAADRLSATAPEVATGYCPCRGEQNLYESARSFRYDGSAYLLSLRGGVEQWPKE